MNKIQVSIGIIGAGNMGSAIAKGIAKSGLIDRKNIFISDNNAEKAIKIAKTSKITASTNAKIAQECSVCLLAVKPDIAKNVLAEIAESLHKNCIVMSIVAGLDIKTGESLIGKNGKFIRIMPNTPAQVGAGMTALSVGKNITKDDLSIAEKIFACVGKVITIDESKMDAVTGLSGSGPAYIFQIIEAMSDGGVLMGLPRDKAIEMAAQTVLGAAKMVLETGLHPAVLKDMVTSPSGTTIEGVLTIEKGGVRKTIIEAIKAGAEKSKYMSGK